MALIHHVAAGAGSPPIVFVHGLACSHTDWQSQVAHFCAAHTIIAVDLPGHGATPAADTSSIERCGMDVAALLRALSVPPAVLVGHSLGCRVVLDAGLRAPEHVAGIVLVDGSRFAPAATQAFEARFAAGEYRALVRGLFQQMFTPRSDAKTAAAVLERALALPEDVGRALLLSLVRYDVDKLESALGRTASLCWCCRPQPSMKRERVSMRPARPRPTSISSAPRCRGRVSRSCRTSAISRNSTRRPRPTGRSRHLSPACRRCQTLRV
jgi:pimeloyl-ACP methyl ester carboxylesterase